MIPVALFKFVLCYILDNTEIFLYFFQADPDRSRLHQVLRVHVGMYRRRGLRACLHDRDDGASERCDSGAGRPGQSQRSRLHYRPTCAQARRAPPAAKTPARPP